MNSFDKRIAALEKRVGGTDYDIHKDPDLKKTTEIILDEIKDFPDVVERIKSRISAIVPRKNLKIDNMINHPDFWDYRGIIVKELFPYPELRKRVSNRLLEMDG